MPLPVTTAAIIQSRSGTGWTLDTTLAYLDTDLLLKDFVVLFGSVVQSNTLFTKVSPVSVLYIGAPITTTTVQLRRRTPIDPIKEVLYGERFSSTDWNREVNRTSRRAAEYEVFGIGSIGDVTGVPNNGVYGASWATDTIFAPTRQAVYTKIEAAVADYIARDATITASITGFAPLASPALTGTPTAPTPAASDNSTKIQTSAGVRAFLSSAADLKALQNATYPTAANTTNTTEIASTAFAHLASVIKKITRFADSTFRTSSLGAWTTMCTGGTITPRSSTSSFLIVAIGNYGCTGAVAVAQRLLINGTANVGNAGFGAYPGATTNYTQGTMTTIYTPGSAASFTVGTQAGGNTNTNFPINQAAGSVQGYTITTESTILVIEFEHIL